MNSLACLLFSHYVPCADVKDICRTAGDVVRADIASDNEGRSKGFAVVLFSTFGGAQRAIDRFNGAELKGRILSAKLDKFV
jgi:RNA recognition motif-containing protein